MTIIGATNHPELLDRAVWRRFQMRMTLPTPTRAGIAAFLERFQREHKIGFETSTETIARKIAGSSYAEVEEFCMQVLRSYVMELPGGDMRKIVSVAMKNWDAITANGGERGKDENT